MLESATLNHEHKIVKCRDILPGDVEFVDNTHMFLVLSSEILECDGYNDLFITQINLQDFELIRFRWTSSFEWKIL